MVPIEITCSCGAIFLQKRTNQTLCRKCKDKEWRQSNRSEISRKEKQLYNESPKRRSTMKSARQNYHNTLRGRLMELASQAKTKYQKGSAAATKTHECDLDTEFLLELWEQQTGQCKISGLAMNYDTRNLRCVSLDRIDHASGYLQGNVQLVCKWANLAKHTADNNEILQIVEDIRRERLCLNANKFKKRTPPNSSRKKAFVAQP